MTMHTSLSLAHSLITYPSYFMYTYIVIWIAVFFVEMIFVEMNFVEMIFVEMIFVEMIFVEITVSRLILTATSTITSASSRRSTL